MICIGELAQLKGISLLGSWILMVLVRSFYSAPVGVRSIVSNPSVCVCVCVYVCVSLCVSACMSTSIPNEPLDRSARNFVCTFPVAVARSSSDGVSLRYAIPVWRMTSRLAVMDETPKVGGYTVQRRRSMTWRYRGGVWCLWMLVYFCVFHRLLQFVVDWISHTTELMSCVYYCDDVLHQLLTFARSA